VLHISMTIQPDGSTKATVKVPSLQDAQYAISRLHRRKIGHKRILISYVTSDKNPPFHVLKSEAVALLNDIPTKSLPLIKFRELYEKRYHRPMTVSDLYKMRDAVTIQGDSGSRIVYLSSEYCKTPSIPESEDSQDSNVVEKQYCERHFHISSSQGWAEQYSVCPLPLVYMSLKTLSTAVHTLLDTHQGCLPLISFCDCYEAEIGPLPVVGNGSYHSTPKTNKGVPLEHLIACVTGVEVAKSVLCIKKVQWLEKKIDSQAYQNVSPALAGQLTLFGREVMDLLKSQPHCLIQFNKFIPIYHHHFGRQCRVADYGFTKLIDLLDSIPHIVQVLGEGQSRQVTLTHRTQIKRFAAELLRILKSRASKQITVTEFPQAYEQVIEKPFDITNYGVCEIDDMLDEVPENVIVTCNSGSEIIIGIPKREQTPEEIERTKLFAEEVIELMKHTPSCSMTFSKFIPSYHHHFGKQCRVADYGFIKLIELFEAIPDVLEVKGNGEDKILNLVEVEQHKILTDRLVSVLKAQPNGIIDVNQISSAYAQMHGHALRPADFGFSDLQELLRKMNSEIRVFDGYGWSYVSLVDHKFIHEISLKLRRLLMEQSDGKLPTKELNKVFQNRFGQAIDLSPYFQDFTDAISVDEGYAQLTPIHLLARDIIILLQEHDSHMLLQGFNSLFFVRFGVTISPPNYGFSSMHSLLESLSDYFSVKGRKQKRMVWLNDKISDFPLLLVNFKKSPAIENNRKGKEDGSQTSSVTPAISISKCSSSLSNRKKIDAIYKDSSSSHDSSQTKFQTCKFAPASKLTILPSAHYVNPQVHSSVDIQVMKSSNNSFVSPHPTAVQRMSVIDNAVNALSSCYSNLQQEKYDLNSHDNIRMNPDLNEMSSNKSFNEKLSLKSKLEFQSHENLTHCSQPLDSNEKDFPSTKSTPTRISGPLSRRNRIAAQFSLPID
ncbi:meiosis regulator and mRNA stability factor 1-like, partial [Uloborus diversus]|uniref:meiosis regulator and mRNA stability factor 1-like n=1 Tax=Uloborus diversus TaxID=327109 RepID=UPI002409A28B